MRSPKFIVCSTYGKKGHQYQEEWKETAPNMFEVKNRCKCGYSPEEDVLKRRERVK